MRNPGPYGRIQTIELASCKEYFSLSHPYHDYRRDKNAAGMGKLSDLFALSADQHGFGGEIGLRSRFSRLGCKETICGYGLGVALGLSEFWEGPRYLEAQGLLAMP
jgi:hypothetical protein